MENCNVGIVRETLTLKGICRICLQLAEENGVSLFSDDKVSKGILDMIFSCFQLIMTYEDFLPHLICSSCLDELNSADKFRLKCVTFEERYSNLCKTKCETLKQDNAEDNSTDEYESHNNEPVLIHAQGFKCNICDKTLKSYASLEKHYVSMHQKRKGIGKVTGSGINRRYHCTECTYSTPYRQTLANHMRRHDGKRPHHCHCGKTFTQLSSLAAHQKTHSNEMLYTCAVCGKQFKHSFSLKNHQRVHDVGKFSCNICSKTLKTSQSLQHHMNRHENIRNYNCEDCGSTFVTSSELTCHKYKHTEAKKVECNLCGYKTSAKKNLIIHMKRHAGEKSFKCDFCHKTEYTNSDLRRHMRVHTQEKPFPCPECSQRFSQSSSLNHHTKRIHGLDYTWGKSKVKVKKEYPQIKNLQ